MTLQASMSRIGWIGFGKMGVPICGRLREAQFQINALCRNQKARDSAASLGVGSVSSIAEAVAGADIVVSAISDDNALAEIVFSEGGVKASSEPGQVYVDVSTVSPSASAKVARAMAEVGVPYLRSPVSGSTVTASKGLLTAIVSGPSAPFYSLAPFFEAFTRKTFHIGESEEARYLKLAVNSMVGATSALLAEALTLARAGGMDARTAMMVIADSAVGSPLIQYKSAAVSAGDYTAAFSCSQMLKDLDLVEQVAAEAPVKTPLIESVRRQFVAAIAAGFAADDFFVLTAEKAQAIVSELPATGER